MMKQMKHVKQNQEPDNIDPEADMRGKSIWYQPPGEPEAHSRMCPSSPIRTYIAAVPLPCSALPDVLHSALAGDRHVITG
jgi:hypothetical protein